MTVRLVLIRGENASYSKYYTKPINCLKNVIFVLMYQRHKPSDPIYKLSAEKNTSFNLKAGGINGSLGASYG
jgi:hypothetical protein